MDKAMDLKHIICILPRRERARIVSTVIVPGGEERRVPVRPETVLRWVAQSYCIDLDLARRRSEAECCMGRGAPIPIGPGNVFLPFHLAVDGEEGNSGAYAFCNVAIQELEVRPDSGGRSILRLGCGMEIPADWSRATLRHHLALAVDAHQRLLRSILSEMPLFALPALLTAVSDSRACAVGMGA